MAWKQLLVKFNIKQIKKKENHIIFCQLKKYVQKAEDEENQNIKIISLKTSNKKIPLHLIVFNNNINEIREPKKELSTKSMKERKNIYER